MTIQSLMFVVTTRKLDMSMASAFVMVLSGIQTFYKVSNAIAQQQKIKKVKSEIEQLFQNLSHKSIEKFSSDIKNFPRLAKFTFIFVTSVTSFFDLVPLITLVIVYFSKGVLFKSLTYSLWYPFNINPLDYFIVFYIYESVISIFLTIPPNITEGAIILSVGQLTILFNSLADEIAEIINAYDEKNEKKTEKELNNKIELHNRLLNLTTELMDIHEIPILFYVLTYASSNCFLLINALLNMELFLPISIVVLNSAVYLFYLCYFGERIMDSVR